MTHSKHAVANPVYEEIAAEWGVTRQRVHQIYLRGMEKLGLQEVRYLRRDTEQPAWKLHIERVVWRIDVAISKRKDARRAGDIRAEYEAVAELDELLDALTWLEARRDGSLEEHLRQCEQRQDEPTTYVATVHHTDHFMTATSGKWTSYALTAPRRK